MHTFGHPCRIDEIAKICKAWHITLIEDSAESLGSFYKGQHTGTFGEVGIFSFNGNKIITSGGGGVIVTDDKALAKRAKHLTTTAKVPHKWEYEHDEIGYNYRMPNLNAALLVAQLENLKSFLADKRALANEYREFFKSIDDISFIEEPENVTSNYWLNIISVEKRDETLKVLNENGIMSRPVWRLLSELEIYKECQSDALSNSRYLESRLINIPSGVRL
jgi:dTDP-4-amino-4,6-dideoxygalactose transaminase